MSSLLSGPLLHVLPTLILQLLILLESQQVQAKPLNSSVKICQTIRLTFEKLQGGFSSESLRKRLRDQVAGCQSVQGSVLIDGFGAMRASQQPHGGDEFRQMDTDFLDSIEEISGQLKIKLVNLERLTFRNLRIIRGINIDGTLDTFYSIDFLEAKFPMKLSLPKLTAITGSGVRVIGNTHLDVYCYLTHRIDWSLLFLPPPLREDSPSPRFLDNVGTLKPGGPAALCAGRHFECSPECSAAAVGINRGLCWSAGPQGCQSVGHRCLNSSRGCRSGACHCDAKTGSKRCCHDTCLGGCSDGGGPGDCSSCRDANLEGVCAADCGRSGSSSLWRLQSLCLKTCPLPYLAASPGNGRRCLLSCPVGEIPVRGACTACPDCVHCSLPTLMLSDFDASDFLARNCNVWQVHSESVDVGPGVMKNPESLKALANVRVFYGTLTVKRLDKLGVSDLRFLRRLEFVSNRLVIMLMKIRYLGLASLRYARMLGLQAVSGLCKAWYPSKWLAAQRDRISVVASGVQFDEASAECRKAACDPACDVVGGECWGPGPEMCVQPTQ